MQAYEGYLEDGQFFPFETKTNIKGRRRVIVTLLDEEQGISIKQAEKMLLAELEKAEKTEAEQGEECLLTPDEVDALLKDI
ncbi:MAG: hypothetical protein FWG44_08560 [Oscillospiraceae bacterium]|nr:hypothetical protein [Oscillospiraceae bacterium]